jgi:outer membrane protein assembly factor BamB
VGSDFSRVNNMQVASAGEGRVVTIRNGERDAVFEMLDGDGATVWSHEMAVSEGEVGLTSVAVGDNGTIYVGGWFRDSLRFGSAPPTLTHTCVEPFERCSAGFLAAFDQVGYLLWLRDTGDVDGGGVTHASAAPGGVAFIEWLRDEEPLEPDAVAPVSESYDVFVVRLDAAGDEVWRHRHLFPPFEPGPDEQILGGGVYEMAADAHGGIVLVGLYTVQTPVEFRSVFTLTKLTADGQQAWTRVAPAGLLALTGDGDIVVTAQFNIFGPPVGSYFMYAHRYDGDTGDLRWTRYLGAFEGGQMYTEDIAIDPAGDVIIVGWTNGSGPVPVGQLSLELAGSGDMFVVRLRGEDGAPLAATTLGIPGADWGQSVTVLGPNDMVVVGGFSDEMVVDGESYAPPPDMFGVFMHRGDPFASPAPFAP